MTTAGDKDKSWKHRLKEIILEVLIIVFAVSLSISLHNWSEARHDRHEEHEFLAGLKKDLENDLLEMKGDSATYQQVLEGVRYFTKVSRGETLIPDSLWEYRFLFYNTTYLAVNNSRFEGLKGSGKLSIIENKELLNSILDLYQEMIPFINLNNQWVNNYKITQLGPYVDKNLDMAKGMGGTGNWQEILRTNEMRNALERLSFTDEIIDHYGNALKKIKSILKMINEELH